MNARADSIIVIDSKHSTRELKMIETWRNSSLVVHVIPDSAYASMTFKVGNVKTNKYVVGARGVYHPVMGYWHFYVPRNKFLHGGDTFFEFDAVDIENNSRHVCGDGRLRIKIPPIDDDDDGVSSSVSDAYIKSDGTWYLLEIGEDEYGGLSVILKDVATENVPLDVEGEAYAYNNQTGMYHKLEVTEDEYGCPMIVVDNRGYEDKNNSFAYEKSTGLYYRIETDRDEAGALMIQIGEQQ